MEQANNALLRFHRKYCSEFPLDNLEVFYKLLKEIKKLKLEVKKDEKLKAK